MPGLSQVKDSLISVVTPVKWRAKMKTPVKAKALAIFCTVWTPDSVG